MYARVPQMMAQFVLKIEKLSHIMGTAPILEMARAYCPPSPIMAPGLSHIGILYRNILSAGLCQGYHTQSQFLSDDFRLSVSPLSSYQAIRL